MRGDEAPDCRISSGPVSDHRHHASVNECLCRLLSFECSLLIDLAGQAPVCREVQKDGLPRPRESRKFCLIEWNRRGLLGPPCRTRGAWQEGSTTDREGDTHSSRQPCGFLRST